ncbi:MAG: class I SAM-dependent methyltransferase [Verrucomicrobiota bacterium]|nr:class I SAM-dependent methyltransferase [Verrucomicrobiota bacterium]
MDKSILTKILGFPATLIHGDTLVLDRWRWLKARLPLTRNRESLLDVGCGSGAFTIGAALRGYHTLGLSWDARNQKVAGERAKICKAKYATFEVLDVRKLDTRKDFYSSFDIAVCCENIEHILDDRKLVLDITRCLKPGGRLLLTTPYLLFHPVTSIDRGPFSKQETGGHVRRGYTKAMLEELCNEAGLRPDRFSFAGGFLSQKITMLFRLVCKVNPLLGWVTVLPFRMLPPIFDLPVAALISYPYFSICLEAYKPRYSDEGIT